MRRIAIRLIVLGIFFGASWISSLFPDSSGSSPSHNAAPAVNAGAQYKSPTSASANSSLSRPAATAVPAITYRGARCIEWTQVRSSHLDTQICIYGRIYTYGPYSNQWDTIQFSSSDNSFRVMDFNYYYLEPLSVGDCAIIYGRIRDYGPYLVITPDKDADDAIRTGPGSFCS